VTGADDGVKKAGDGAEHAHGSTASVLEVSVGDAGAGLAASVSMAGDMAETQSVAAPVVWPSLGTVLRFKTHTEHAVSRRPWKRSWPGSRLPLAEPIDHSSNAGVTLDIENNEERSTVAEPCATDVEACPVAVVAPARAITRYSVAPATEAGDPTRIRTLGSRAATAASRGLHAGRSGTLGSRSSRARSRLGVAFMAAVETSSEADTAQHTRATRAAAMSGRASDDGPGRSRRLPDSLEPGTVPATEAAAVQRGRGARPSVRSGEVADESLLVAQERARIWAGRRRSFTEHVRPRDARRAALDYRRTTDGDSTAAESEDASSHQRRGR